MNEYAKLKWRCRRGTLELDKLLQGYLENVFKSAKESEKTQFIQLLEMEDDLLQAYLIDNTQEADASFAELFQKIKAQSAH